MTRMFKSCCRTRAERMTRKDLNYACLSQAITEGGFLMAWTVRLSVIPTHFTTVSSQAVQHAMAVADRAGGVGDLRIGGEAEKQDEADRVVLSVPGRARVGSSKTSGPSLFFV
jgi:hypothetical protein